MIKRLPSLALALLLLLAVGFEAHADKFEALRLHIIANSDSQYDQELKLKVRDKILERMSPLLGSAADSEEAKLVMVENGSLMLSVTNEVLKENGADYGATMEIGNFYFPTRTYGEQIYPAGNYDSLRITLGNGDGHNWWCVMFPPLCLIDVSSAKTIKKGKTIKFKSWFYSLFQNKQSNTY